MVPPSVPEALNAGEVGQAGGALLHRGAAIDAASPTLYRDERARAWATGG